MKKLFFVLLLFSCGSALAQIEPTAGSWKTWIIASVKDYRLPPPPDKAASQQELKQMLQARQRIDSSTQAQVLYWNTSFPGYRWQEIADYLGGNSAKNNLRLVQTLIDIATYDATIAAWDSKYAYQRPRPGQANAAVKPSILLPSSPSYPCEHSVVAGVAATLLAKFFPTKADTLLALAQQAMQSRVAAGVAYPSDVAAGFELGKRVAEKAYPLYKEYESPAWDGKMPSEKGVWTGKNPLDPMRGKAKTWLLASSQQFRPPPPPDFTKDMEELRQFKPTPHSIANAFYYANRFFWLEQINQRILEYNLHLNPPRAARIVAVRSMATWDALAACWDAKYTYWGIRPNQLDTTFKPVLINNPNFPGYPSGHAVNDGMQAVLLSYFFPFEQQFFQQKALEAAESRFEGGVHFRTDNEVGLLMGRQIGAYVLEKIRQDGADSPSRLVKR